MCGNNVHFARIKVEIPLRVQKRRGSVGKAVPAVTGIRDVPVIEKIVMQKRAANDAASVCKREKPPGYPQSGAGHEYGMLEAAYAAVLNEIFFRLKQRVTENVAAVLINELGNFLLSCLSKQRDHSAAARIFA